MSWSVSSSGKAKDVAVQIADQGSHIHCSDSGEQETAQGAVKVILQTLQTFDPEKPVTVAACGSMNYKNWTDKTGASQMVSIKIEPIHFTA